MANLQERRDKDGKLISYSIRVHRGRDSDGKQLKPFTTTFKVNPSWSEKTARKKAEAFAAVYEKECREGVRSDSRQRFRDYCEYYLSLKETRGTKHSSIVRYRKLTKRIYPAIGHLKLTEIRVDQLNDFYTSLMADGQNKHTGGGLSARTVHDYHQLISAVLNEAVIEGLIPFNVATRAYLPKIVKKEVNYFQPEEVAAILEALNDEPIKWKTLVTLLLVTGMRRGEVLGLRWSDVDFTNNRIRICNNVIYTPDRGIYNETPKTPNSIRYISIPNSVMQLLDGYKLWQTGECHRLGELYQDHDYVFARANGTAMNPNAILDWMNSFSKRRNLPHLNPHAFRHTMTSTLIFEGADDVSVSKRLGHSSVSTTMDIYAHLIAEADERNADVLDESYFKKL